MSFRILSLSGGGFLGLYTAALLAELEERSGRSVADAFDLFAGTSIGGIIALGLSAGRSAVEIRDTFIAHGPAIFPKDIAKYSAEKFGRFLRNIPSPSYSPTALRDTIADIVGSETRMFDLRRPTVIPAVNLTKGGPRIFKTGHNGRFVIDWRLPVVDVALATSAAPTYFPAHRIGNELFADGGMYANSPDLIALHEAEMFLGVDRKEVKVLSIGTTTTDFAMSGSADPNLGLWGWAKGQRLSNIMIGAQQALTNDMMIHALGDRYMRIDRRQSDEQRLELALDVATPRAIANLQSLAANSFAEVSADPRLLDFLSHDAPEFTFINANF
ncbi:CBASS cGAMP-activated phospholipase [Allopontixanthobacter sp.]|uniref:CBASS cGAMP-activated phospholipase n=1 Tax=Allopontixanthobacter sp. TaxID=2906452 RepID=UPI002AB9EB9D|nr:CBASS cGAMP-activated phospholipase [Allopontixanthobacter sp.]MDZ4307115.1 CBASS cGAMP-activated phospholipase [Allopontixanthobacter sp.]